MKIEYLIPCLHADDVISSVEMNYVTSEEASLRQQHKLLSLIALKSPTHFDRFLEALTKTGQGHVTTVLMDKLVEGKES